ncbi:MAG: hypothetical protein GY801_25090, partial [bacterium]|nr:hypothetical protein [bacterium]
YLAVKGTKTIDLPGTAIDLTRIKTFLNKSKALQKILILDCHYGGQHPPYHVEDPESIEAQLHLKGKGQYIISSSLEPGEPPDEEELHSPLTKYLIEGLSSGKADLNESGKVTVEEWYTHLERQMTDLELPQPLRWHEGVDGNWIVARNAEDSEEAAKILPAGLRRNYKYIGEMFRDGSVIPFLGSGIVMESLPPLAADADNEDFSETPLERDLAQRMAEQAEFLEEAQRNPLTVISQHYQTNVIGARALFYKQLKKLFPQNVRPGPIHRFLVQQEKPMLVLTTCYDTLLEELFREQGKKFVVVTHIAYAEDEGTLGKVAVQYSDRPDEAEIGLSDELSIDLEEWWVFYKIQGSFDLFTKGLGGKEELDSIVISEEDYVTFLSRLGDQHRTVPTLFSRLFQQRMFLFLGYRMTDWNFRTVVHVLRKEEKIRKIKGYAVRHSAAGFERQYWESKNVQIIEMQVSEFVKDLAGEMGISVQ